ncbi:ABC transporter substrate-binding protein [Algoriphagus sp. H41]|uniref:ABC transporter substrate-binding protein n=1 Tax=Algoriphagus oliviformis TaxID=2811231 RepID=A0ABS3C9C2_9BACT|nr:helical backbone metal receptor [Algoriphagus oliviformis]MBN7813710.1 ABC transporter substrate-binding protein [Algoriphagus oliviformis]
MFFTDHLSRKVSIPHPPQRIISLVPSQTELLVDLGLEDRLVGVTKFCVHPTQLRKSKTVVGGTKNYRFELIDELQPDLIIGNKEENEREGIAKLAEKHPVWMSDIVGLEDSLRMISDLGQITATETRAEELARTIRTSFAQALPQKGRAVYLIWDNPKMAAGKKTFIDAMLRFAGFENAIDAERYPTVEESDLASLAPEYVLLSSEPFPFSEKHAQELQLLLPKSKILLVDGEMFSWYGSRLLHAMDYFKRL